MDFYPFHIGDFNQATRHLDRIERSIYRDLIDLYYDTEEPLPCDVERVAKLILANDRLTDVERVLNEFFTVVGNVYRHARCDGEIRKYQAKLSQAALAGKASGRARRKARGGSSVSERPLNDRSSPVEPTMNHEPRTIERGNGTKKFVPPTLKQLDTFQKEANLERFDSETFIDHYENTGWKIGGSRTVMKDWKRAARNWAKREAMYNGKGAKLASGRLVLPSANEHLADFASKNNLPPPNSGESFDSYRGRLNSAVEKLRNKND